MDIFKLERACAISKGLIPMIKNILDFVSDKRSDIKIDTVGKSLQQLTFGDEEFQNKLIQLLNETRDRLQKEFDEL